MVVLSLGSNVEILSIQPSISSESCSQVEFNRRDSWYSISGTFVLFSFVGKTRCFAITSGTVRPRYLIREMNVLQWRMMDCCQYCRKLSW